MGDLIPGIVVLNGLEGDTKDAVWMAAFVVVGFVLGFGVSRINGAGRGWRWFFAVVGAVVLPGFVVILVWLE